MDHTIGKGPGMIRRLKSIAIYRSFGQSQTLSASDSQRIVGSGPVQRVPNLNF